MLKSKVERFIAKRVLIVFIGLAVIDLLFINQRWLALAGLAIGTIFGLLKFTYTASGFAHLLMTPQARNAAGRSVLRYAFGQALTVVILAVSIVINLYFFAGVTVGVLLVTFAVIVNSITEYFGITHNNFE